MSKTQFRTSPNNRVVSTFKTKADVEAMVKEIQAAGFKNDGHTIGIHHGEEGMDFIDPEGSRHGFFARLTRARQRLGSWEASMLEQVEAALNSNQYVASVLTDSSQKQRMFIRDIMKKYTSQTIYYQGNYSIEILQKACTNEDNPLSEQVMLIRPFDIKVEETPSFLRSWQQETEQLKQQQGLIQGRLHQSIQKDPRFRFVNMARWVSPTAFSALFGEVDTPHLYQLAVEQVGHETEYQDHVIIINLMKVAMREVGSFAEYWSQISESVAQQAGFISATLYQAIDPAARFQFVNYAQWCSIEAHAKFRQQLAVTPDTVTTHSGIYQVALVSKGVHS